MAPKRNNNEKWELVEMIRDNWPVLKDAFSPALSNTDKNRTWEKIFNDCKAKGHSWTIGKTVTFLRKTKWPGIRRDAVVSYDYARSSQLYIYNMLHSIIGFKWSTIPIRNALFFSVTRFRIIVWPSKLCISCNFMSRHAQIE